LPVATDPRSVAAHDLLLLVTPDGLRLQLTGARASGPVGVDFGNAAMRHRRRPGGNELLGRAVGVGRKSPLAVLDATAGLGRDGFVLADLGCNVALCERNPVLAEMLDAAIALARGAVDPWLSGAAGRLGLYRGDAREAGGKVLSGVDVIYLDPMFPARDKSAAVKKEMATLQALLGDDDDAGALFDWALAQDVARVVVKRPPRAPALGGRSPSHCISGKAVRYDVVVLRGLG
jgi:16S rRNA (guanine1516-N2)-methyltransferase